MLALVGPRRATARGCPRSCPAASSSASRSPGCSRPTRGCCCSTSRCRALDKNLRDTLKYSILDLQRRTGKTAIYVTHDQSEAFAISDRIVVMNAGRIEQIGTQTDIYLQPETPYVAEFIGANNGLRGTVDRPSTATATRPLARSMPAGTGSARPRSRPGSRVGQSVVAYVRPEDIEIVEDGDGPAFENVLEGTIERVIFEGPTAQLRVDVGGRELRVDVSGNERLTLMRRDGDGPARLRRRDRHRRARSRLSTARAGPGVGDACPSSTRSS